MNRSLRTSGLMVNRAALELPRCSYKKIKFYLPGLLRPAMGALWSHEKGLVYLETKSR